MPQTDAQLLAEQTPRFWCIGSSNTADVVRSSEQQPVMGHTSWSNPPSSLQPTQKKVPNFERAQSCPGAHLKPQTPQLFESEYESKLRAVWPQHRSVGLGPHLKPSLLFAHGSTGGVAS